MAQLETRAEPMVVQLLKGQRVADICVVLGSIDVVLGSVDR